MSFDFVVHPIHLERFPLISTDRHACSWLTLQSRRGLAPNTLAAYSRALERYLEFLKRSSTVSVTVTRGDVGLYLASFQGALSNATVQQLLTVVRLFHAYLMEEGIRSNNPVTQTSGGRGMVARHHKLPWIPNEEDWQAILVVARAEPIRNRAMLAFAYDAGLRREELCCLQTGDLDPSRRMLRVRAETTKGRRERVLPIRYPAASCCNSTSNRDGRSVASVARSSSPSRAATTVIRSRSGAGRRLSGVCRNKLKLRGSRPTRYGTFA